MQNVHFTPPQLAPMFGVNVSTIKRWVDKGYLDAEVTAGGHRRITRDQLATFIKKYPKYSNAYTLKRLQEQKHDIRDEMWEEYYRLLETNDMRQAERYIDKLYIQNFPIKDIINRVIMPALRHMGEQYHAKELSIYEEHRMSFLIRMHVIRLDGYVPLSKNKKTRSVILACAPGEFNELPLQIIALLFKLHGWRPHVLGINISLAEMKKAIDRIKPAMVVPTKTYTNKPSTKYFNALTAYCAKRNICIGLGGPMWKEFLKKQPKDCWSRNDCVHYFRGTSDFEEFLAKLKPGRTS